MYLITHFALYIPRTCLFKDKKKNLIKSNYMLIKEMINFELLEPLTFILMISVVSAELPNQNQ